MISAEAAPLASTGGLGSVVSSLSGALLERGAEVTIVLPMYRRCAPGPGARIAVREHRTSRDEPFRVVETRLPGGVPVRMIDVPEMFDRPGMYGPSAGHAYADNAHRFALFCRAAAALVEDMPSGPDVVHCHDWHTGLVPAYLPEDLRLVFTIHNLAYQGNFDASLFARATLLDAGALTRDPLEYWGGFSFMKAGILMSDRVTTVSPRYAREILEDDAGMGMAGVLRSRAEDLRGILNGIDYSLWDPSTDRSIAASFDGSGIGPRRRCTADLRNLLGLDGAGHMILGMVTRLTPQKGIELLLDAVPELLRRPVDIALLGSGDPALESRLKAAAASAPGRFGLVTRFDVELSRKIYAGAHCFLMPSIFEPCGISQMIAMRYGSVPIVRRTGGLADTVSPAGPGSGTGFLFDGPDRTELLSAVDSALALHGGSPQAWAWLVRRCMAEDNSWAHRVGEYMELYREAAHGDSGRRHMP